MVRHLKMFGILGMIVAMAQPVWADGFGFAFRADGGGGGRGGGGRQAAPAPQPSRQQQFFGQSAGRQQQFFAQPVFPHSNFQQTQGPQGAFVPRSVFSQQVWVSPPVNYYLPPQFYYGYQPNFYVAPTYYGNGPTVLIQPTVVYQSPQPTNSYASNPQPRLTFGLIGRW